MKETKIMQNEEPNSKNDSASNTKNATDEIQNGTLQITKTTLIQWIEMKFRLLLG